MAHICLEYLHFTTLNLAEKSEHLPIEPVVSKLVNSSAKLLAVSTPAFYPIRASQPSVRRPQPRICRQVLPVAPPRASGTNANTHYLGVSTSPQTRAGGLMVVPADLLSLPPVITLLSHLPMGRQASFLLSVPPPRSASLSIAGLNSSSKV